MELQLPWMELAVALPLLGALWVSRLGDSGRVRRHSIVIATLAFVCAAGAFLEFIGLEASAARGPSGLSEAFFGAQVFVIDELSAPLLPLTALLFALTILATLRTAVRRFSFASALVTESLVLGALASRTPWLVVALLVLGALPALLEQRRKGRSTRIYLLHMGAFSLLLVAGQVVAWLAPEQSGVPTAAVVLSTLGLLIRCGVFPFHGWVTDQFERGSFGTAILNATPMLGVYGMLRLVVPVAPAWVLDATAGVAIVTATYAASMTLVQRDVRRFFSFVFIGHSALVLVGLDLATPVGLTGALSTWLAVGLSLTGFGLTLRCIEARTGRLSLTEYHGLFPHVPVLAAFFLLTGLASIGFPGTIGFVGLELLFEGALDVSAVVGGLLVLAAALNGLAVLFVYFRIFTGRDPGGTIDLRIRPAERVAVLILTILILGGGVYPQPGISSRYHAATELISIREQAGLEPAQRTASSADPLSTPEPRLIPHFTGQSQAPTQRQ